MPGRNDSRVPGGDPETQGAMISKQNEGCWGPGVSMSENWLEIMLKSRNSRKSMSSRLSFIHFPFEHLRLISVVTLSDRGKIDP